MNWYISQEVVALKNNDDYSIKKGQVFTIIGLRSPQCRCNIIDLDIGLKMHYDFQYCDICNQKDIKSNGIAWQDERDFAPLEYNQDAINELLEQTKVEYAKL